MPGTSPAREVVVTGVGPWTPIGTGAEALWAAVLEGRSGTRSLAGRPMYHGLKTAVGAPAPDPQPDDARLTPREAGLLDPATWMALAATRLALDDAGIETRPVGDRKNSWRPVDLDPDRVGVILGTGIGGLTTLEASHALHTRGERLRGALRYSVPMLIPNAAPAQIAIKYGLRGECKAVTTACASGTMALGDAYRLLRDGEADVVLAGGVDRVLSTRDGWAFMGFDILNTMSTRNHDPERAARPFDADRDGFVMGDGAGIVVLETEAHARSRDARIRGRVLGYGTTCDAHSMMQLDPGGDALVRCMQSALRSAGLEPGDVGYVNAHGTGTRQNDPQECAAIRRVLGDATDDVLVNSTKAMTGHGIAGSGGIEAIVTVLSLESGRVHRCVNLDRPDPACDVPLPRDTVDARPRVALSNSFGFGGHNSTLVLGRP
jgi:3-oxoacyl-[acyl-carrier-protein] synthase II